MGKLMHEITENFQTMSLRFQKKDDEDDTHTFEQKHKVKYTIHAFRYIRPHFG